MTDETREQIKRDAEHHAEIEDQVNLVCQSKFGIAKSSFYSGATHQHSISFEAGKQAGRNEAIEEALKEVRHYKGLFEYPEDYTELIKQLEKLRTTTI